ncbi:hypothetical protein AVEN_205133-1 [Araneus ventricosus]|uniref:Uncharacterized protein n=1 Tax=Araneus ventricosus TaxID=182803 RepID=A0A4Y2IQZ6_ARAVE|nr:hypothetical protein AVEN_205133-1 [Araneus ventricosus]
MLPPKVVPGQNLNCHKGSFWFECAAPAFSVVGFVLPSQSHLVKIEGFHYEEYGLYAALVPCLLAVFWSCVLIYDARCYWRMWQRVVGNATAGVQVIFRS